MENQVKAPALAGRVAVVTGAGGVFGSDRCQNACPPTALPALTFLSDGFFQGIRKNGRQ